MALIKAFWSEGSALLSLYGRLWPRGEAIIKGRINTTKANRVMEDARTAVGDDEIGETTR